jgi:hypothetical protein
MTPFNSPPTPFNSTPTRVASQVKEPSMCAKRLGAEALTRASGDNITVVIAFVKDVSTAELVTWERAF